MRELDQRRASMQAAVHVVGDAATAEDRELRAHQLGLSFRSSAEGSAIKNLPYLRLVDAVGEDRGRNVIDVASPVIAENVRDFVENLLALVPLRVLWAVHDGQTVIHHVQSPARQDPRRYRRTFLERDRLALEVRQPQDELLNRPGWSQRYRIHDGCQGRSLRYPTS